MFQEKPMLYSILYVRKLIDNNAQAQLYVTIPTPLLDMEV